MRKNMECPEEQFLKNVAKHKMTVIRDDGLHRHLRFQQPDTINMQFDLLTWPGYLCFTGDMGTFVFCRLEDMFMFFRSDPNDSRMRDDITLPINPHYWSEKLEAVDRADGAFEYSPDKFRRIVNEKRIEWMREAKANGTLSKEQRRELWEAVDHQVLYVTDDGDYAAHAAARDFSHRVSGERYEFRDFWEHDLTTYTFHFIWCCYAITWGVRQYDALHQLPKAA